MTRTYFKYGEDDLGFSGLYRHRRNGRRRRLQLLADLRKADVHGDLADAGLPVLDTPVDHRRPVDHGPVGHHRPSTHRSPVASARIDDRGRPRTSGSGRTSVSAFRFSRRRRRRDFASVVPPRRLLSGTGRTRGSTLTKWFLRADTKRRHSGALSLSPSNCYFFDAARLVGRSLAASPLPLSPALRTPSATEDFPMPGRIYRRQRRASPRPGFATALALRYFLAMPIDPSIHVGYIRIN